MASKTRQALQPLVLGVACALACAAPVAQASLIGNTVTFELQLGADKLSTTGVAGTDALDIAFGPINSRFIPRFLGNSIGVDLPGDTFGIERFMPGDTMRFAGLSSPGQRIASVVLFEQVGGPSFTQSGLTWTDSSLTLDLGGMILIRELGGSQPFRFDITFEPVTVTGVPEPGTLTLLGAAGLGLWLSRHGGRRTPVAG